MAQSHISFVTNVLFYIAMCGICVCAFWGYVIVKDPIKRKKIMSYGYFIAGVYFAALILSCLLMLMGSHF